MYGDTAAGRKRVAQLREQGGDIRALAARLVAQAEAVPWHGKAADAMRERIKERADHLRAAAGHHETAADSLARHLQEVDTLKEAIDTRSPAATVLPLLKTKMPEKLSSMYPGSPAFTWRKKPDALRPVTSAPLSDTFAPTGTTPILIS